MKSLSVLAIFGALSSAVAQINLLEEFRVPSAQYRPKFRYWLPDASIPADVVSKDIKSIAGVGAGGFEFLPYYQFQSPNTNWSEFAYGSDAYHTLFHAALVAANETGILMDFAVGANQGQGVPAEPESLGLAVELAYVNLTVKSGETFNDTLPLSIQPTSAFLEYFMHGLDDFGRQNLSAVVAVEISSELSGSTTISQVTDLSSLVDPSTRSLVWTAPQGLGDSNWRLIVWYERYTNQRSVSAGLNPTSFLQNGSWIIDHFSAAGSHLMTNFFDEHVLRDATNEKLLATVGKFAWEDSMEMETALWWTQGITERFQASRGYNIAQCLPFLITESNFWASSLVPYGESFVSVNETFSNNCIDDYRLTLQEGYVEYIKANVKWAHAKGIEYSNQPAYNLPLNMLDAIPLLDASEGESLGFKNKPDAYRYLSGPAHLAGISVISSECGAVATSAYTQTLSDLLWSTRRGLATGISMNVFHGFSYSGPYEATTWPGFTIFAYTHTEMWTPSQPIWRHINESLAYVARNQFVSQAGVPKVDLAIYSFAVPFTGSPGYGSDNLQNTGFTYDYLGPGSLESEKAIVQNGVLALNGPAYRGLVFANETKISLNAATKVLEWAQHGLPIFFVCNASLTSIGGKAGEPASVSGIMSQLIGSSLDNVIVVASAEELPIALDNAHIRPRAALPRDESAQAWYSFWRSTDDTELVFLYNDGTEASTVAVDFSGVNGTKPYIFDAWTGHVSPVLQYEINGMNIKIPITLAPNQTTIIAFETTTSHLPPPSRSIVTSVLGSVAGMVYSYQKNSSTSQILAYLSQGLASITLSTGETRHFNATPPAALNLTIWNITIEDWHATEDVFSMELAIDIHKYNDSPLVAWKDLDPTVLTNVSGVAEYVTLFDSPIFQGRLGARLHLGSITDSAQVSLNGIRLPPVEAIGGPEIVMDITDYLSISGENELRVEIATTLYNRILATMDTTMTMGRPASLANAAFFAANPPKAYGLLGPVWVEWVEVVQV